jgi:hypothetical protein
MSHLFVHPCPCHHHATVLGSASCIGRGVSWILAMESHLVPRLVYVGYSTRIAYWTQLKQKPYHRNGWSVERLESLSAPRASWVRWWRKSPEQIFCWRYLAAEIGTEDLETFWQGETGALGISEYLPRLSTAFEVLKGLELFKMRVNTYSAVDLQKWRTPLFLLLENSWIQQRQVVHLKMVQILAYL